MKLFSNKESRQVFAVVCLCLPLATLGTLGAGDCTTCGSTEPPTNDTDEPEVEEIEGCASVLGMIEDGAAYQCVGNGDPEFSADLSCLHYDACFGGVLEGSDICLALEKNCPDVDEHPEPRLLFKKLFDFTFGNEAYEDALVSACCNDDVCGLQGENCDLESACEGACATMVCENVPELLALYRSSVPFMAGICCASTDIPNEGPLLDVCNGVADVWISHRIQQLLSVRGADAGQRRTGG